MGNGLGGCGAVSVFATILVWRLQFMLDKDPNGSD